MFLQIEVSVLYVFKLMAVTVHGRLKFDCMISYVHNISLSIATACFFVTNRGTLILTHDVRVVKFVRLHVASLIKAWYK